MSYLKDGLLLEDKEEARKLRVKATRFVLMDEMLYKRGFSQPYLRCLTLDKFVRTYVIHLLGTYVTILCNWLIL